MSKQLLIDRFFNGSKSSSKTYSMSDNFISLSRKRSIKLEKDDTPIQKTPKINVPVEIITLSSDDEDSGNNDLPSCKQECEVSDSDSSTIILSPSSLCNVQSSQTPGDSSTKVQTQSPSTQGKSSQGHLLQTPPPKQPQTPKAATPHTPESNFFGNSTFTSPSSNSESCKSSTSKTKFFSPSKNRIVTKSPASNVRRNLSLRMSTPAASNNNDKIKNINHNNFTKACQGLDDKTQFLFKIIYEYLNEPSLKDLLESESQQLLRCYGDLPTPGMKLICRLFWRKEGWYNIEEMNQIISEVSQDKALLDQESLQYMLDQLESSKFMVKSDHKTMSFHELEKQLNRTDLVEICKALKINVSTRKDAIEALVAYSKKSNITQYFKGIRSFNENRVLQMMSKKITSTLYKMTDLARNTLHKLHILMYLGLPYSIIREKKLEFLLIYDKIGREVFPVDKNMDLDNASIIYTNNEEFDKYVKALDLYENYKIEKDNKERCHIVEDVYNLYKNMNEDETACCNSLPAWLRRFTPAYKYVKLLEAGVQDLKREKSEDHNRLALAILTALIKQPIHRQHKKPEWYAEKALILHSSFRKFDEAAEVLIEGFCSGMSEEAKDVMRPRARKFATQKNAPLGTLLKSQLTEYAASRHQLEKILPANHIYKQPMDRHNNRGKVKFETRTAGELIVKDAEDYCIGHYITSGKFTDGEHWEGRIVNTIFFLLFWDIIYQKPANVRGVFLSYYQQYPLDMFYQNFYQNRKAAIENKLNLIENATEEELLTVMKQVWTSRPETELSGIHRNVGWSSVRAVSLALGPRALSALCRRLATDYQHAHSGFPDLTLWHRERNTIKFVEVKTDSDKPSMKQIQWMNYLKEHNIDTEFCYVGANTMRQRCRATDSPKKKADKNKTKKTVANTSTPVNKPTELDDSDEFQESMYIKQESVNNIDMAQHLETILSEPDVGITIKQETGENASKQEKEENIIEKENGGNTSIQENGENTIKQEKVQNEIKQEKGESSQMTSVRLQDNIQYMDSEDCPPVKTDTENTPQTVSDSNTNVEKPKAKTIRLQDRIQFQTSQSSTESCPMRDIARQSWDAKENLKFEGHSIFSADTVVLIPTNMDVIELD